MDIRALQIHLNKKNLDDFLYLIQGDDFYLREEAESIIKNHLTKKATSGEIDLEVYYGSQFDRERCLDSINTLSFFSSLKVIHIKEAEVLKVKFMEELLQGLSSDNRSGLCVILTFSKIDKRKKVFKELLNLALSVEVKSPYDNQIEGWIQYIADKEKLKISREAQRYLNFLVGPSLIEISKKISNLKEVFGDESVEKAEVHELVSKNGEDDVFKICDYIGRGELSEALLGTEHLLGSGSNAIGVLALFYRHFKILEGIHTETLKNKKTSTYLSKKDLAAKVGVPTFFLQNYQHQTKIWTRPKVLKVFSALEAADFSLKSTKLKDRSVFSALFVDLSKILGNRKTAGAFSDAVAGL